MLFEKIKRGGTMKNKLIAAIISICIIGGLGAAIVLGSKVDDSSNLADKKVIQEKSIEENNSIEKDDDKSQENVEVESVEITNDSDVQTAMIENSQPIQNYVEKEMEASNDAIENYTEESTQVVESEQNSIEFSEPNIETQTPSYSSDFMAEVESMIFNKVNEERSKNGLAPLSYNSTMERYARIKSQDMGDRGYFDHNNPEGELITAQMQRDGVSYSSWGENIAYIGGVSDAATLANQFMTNWMNSSGHRANILSTNFTSIGVGVYKIGNTVYATQEFYR